MSTRQHRGGNIVANNLIGYQADGNSAGGNQTGVFVYNSPSNILQYNRIGYSASTGITLSGPSSQGNLIQNNGVGLDASADSPGNSGAGVGDRLRCPPQHRGRAAFGRLWRQLHHR